MSSGPDLRKTLGVRDLALFYIATSFSIRWIATASAAGPSALVIWVMAALCLFVPLVSPSSSSRRDIRRRAASTSGASVRSAHSPDS
jgi:hypothetical protein